MSGTLREIFPKFQWAKAIYFYPVLLQEVATAQQKIEEEKKVKEALAVEAARFARREARAKRLETHFNDICPALMLPHAQKHLRKITDTIEPFGMVFLTN